MHCSLKWALRALLQKNQITAFEKANSTVTEEEKIDKKIWTMLTSRSKQQQQQTTTTTAAKNNNNNKLHTSVREYHENIWSLKSARENPGTSEHRGGAPVPLNFLKGPKVPFL